MGAKIKEKDSDNGKGISKRLDKIEALINSLLAEVDLVLEIEHTILDKLNEKLILTKARIKLMSAKILVGGTAQATILGVDQNGNPFPLDASYQVAYSASNPANVSFGTPNADGSDVVTGVAPDTGDVIGASITRPDGTVIAAGTDTLEVDVVPPPTPVLTSATVVLTANASAAPKTSGSKQAAVPKPE